MKTILSNEILLLMKEHLSPGQNRILESTLHQVFSSYELPILSPETPNEQTRTNLHLIDLFLSSKKIEGCSDNTLKYYRNTLDKMVSFISKNISSIETNDLRLYLSEYHAKHQCSKTTLDNIRRILSSFFSWLEDED